MDPIHLKELKALCLRTEPVGSRVTCNPPPTDTDQDWLMLFQAGVKVESNGKLINRSKALRDLNYVLSNHEDYKSNGLPEDFRAFRKGEINLVTTSSVLFYNDFILATGIVKNFNVMHKSTRIAFFESVFDKDWTTLKYLIAGIKKYGQDSISEI